MLWRGLSGLALRTLVAAVAGCTSTAAPTGDGAGAAVAVPGYAAPSGAPDFCARLAETEHVGQLPVAVGRKTVRDSDTSAVSTLQLAIGELEDVLDEVSDEDRHASVSAALEDLLAAAHAATEHPVHDALVDRLTGSLKALGDEVQPLCTFPT